MEETEDQVILTWSCNDVLELNEAIQDTYLAKAGVRLSNDFEEQIFCTKQGVLQKAQCHTKDSDALITLQDPSDPSLVQTYFEQLFNPSHAIGDPLEAYPLA